MSSYTYTTASASPSGHPPNNPLPLIRFLQHSIPAVSALTTGLNLGLSAFLTPRLLESPTPVMLRQWLATYNIGKQLFPALGGVSALGYFILANHFGINSSSSAGGAGGVKLGRGYLVSGLLCVGIVPFTLVAMVDTNKLLVAMEEKVREAEVVGADGAGDGDKPVALSEESEKGAKYLVDHWGMLNLGRSAMLGLAAVISVGVLL